MLSTGKKSALTAFRRLTGKKAEITAFSLKEKRRYRQLIGITGALNAFIRKNNGANGILLAK